MRYITALILVFFANAANADEYASEMAKVISSMAEVWDCGESNSSEALVVAAIGENRTRGLIQVAGTFHLAQFTVDGFDRKWSFGIKEDEFRYAFVITPKGDGMYIYFPPGSKQAEPSEYYTCSQRK